MSRNTIPKLKRTFRNANTIQERCCVPDLRDEDVQASGHREASVLDLHLLPSAVLVRVLAHELKRVVHTERLGRTDITSRSNAKSFSAFS